MISATPPSDNTLRRGRDILVMLGMRAIFVCDVEALQKFSGAATNAGNGGRGRELRNKGEN